MAHVFVSAFMLLRSSGIAALLVCTVTLIASHAQAFSIRVSGTAFDPDYGTVKFGSAYDNTTDVSSLSYSAWKDDIDSTNQAYTIYDEVYSNPAVYNEGNVSKTGSSGSSNFYSFAVTAPQADRDEGYFPTGDFTLNKETFDKTDSNITVDFTRNVDLGGNVTYSIDHVYIEGVEAFADSQPFAIYVNGDVEEGGSLLSRVAAVPTVPLPRSFPLFAVGLLALGAAGAAKRGGGRRRS